MVMDSLELDTPKKRYSKFNSKNSKKIMTIDFRVSGFNEDISELYHWHLNFPYYTGKGYTPIKLEDYHYFSENSQLGAQMRQMKGGSIRAFQENLAQIVTLIKTHLIPLLQEIKQADFYKSWFDKIVENDNLIQEEIKKNGETESNREKLNKWRRERNEALNHLKDKWVNEVDGGKLWQMNRSSTEQGYDFSLLPQLFFGTNLDDPFQKRSTLKEQLDGNIYSVDISEGAKTNIANFMYRFYTWLPSAVKDTNVTFRLKIAALKQFYSQIQMYINFMKPLLIEIAKKSEGFEKDNFYRNFDSENPEFANLFDYSYSFIRILGIRNFAEKNRGKWKMTDLEFTKFGLYLRIGEEILFGEHKGKKGFIKDLKGDEYEFYISDKKDISDEEFKKLKKVKLYKKDLKVFPIMEYLISQKRRTDLVSTPQGPQQIPYMTNDIKYNAYAWNIFEIASYRESLKEDNLKLLETFIEEISVIKEDLLYYVNDLSSSKLDSEDNKEEVNKSEKESKKEPSDYTLLVGPFRAFYTLFSDFIPDLKNTKKVKKITMNSERDKHHLVVKLQIAEDLWKVYTVYKKSHGFIMY